MFEAMYHVPTDRLYIRLNGTNSFSAGHKPGTAGVVLSDTRGSLDVSKTTVTRSGTTLTVNWHVAASSALNGSNPIFLRAKDRGDLVTSFFRPDTSWRWDVS